MYFILLARGEVVKPLSRLDIMLTDHNVWHWRRILRWTVQRQKGIPSCLRREWICVPLHPIGSRRPQKDCTVGPLQCLCWDFLTQNPVSETQSDLFWAALALHEKANTARLPDISFFKFQAFVISDELLICWFAALMQWSEVTVTAVIV